MARTRFEPVTPVYELFMTTWPLWPAKVQHSETVPLDFFILLFVRFTGRNRPMLRLYTRTNKIRIYEMLLTKSTRPMRGQVDSQLNVPHFDRPESATRHIYASHV